MRKTTRIASYSLPSPTNFINKKNRYNGSSIIKMGKCIFCPSSLEFSLLAHWVVKNWLIRISQKGTNYSLSLKKLTEFVNVVNGCGWTTALSIYAVTKFFFFFFVKEVAKSPPMGMGEIWSPSDWPDWCLCDIVTDAVNFSNVVN